jgi:MraZ protein
MFRSTSNHTIDEKGRIIIPARFRDVIKANGDEGVMVSRIDGHLRAYTYDEWREIEAKARNQPKKNARMRRVIRFFIGDAVDCTWDKQDRILISPTMREYAGLDRDIVLVGALEYFEIWSKDNYQKEYQAYEDDLQTEEARDEIAELGI